MTPMELRRKMRIGPLLMAAGLLLVLCAAALAGYNLWDGARAGRGGKPPRCWSSCPRRSQTAKPRRRRRNTS